MHRFQRLVFFLITFTLPLCMANPIFAATVTGKQCIYVTPFTAKGTTAVCILEGDDIYIKIRDLEPLGFQVSYDKDMPILTTVHEAASEAIPQKTILEHMVLDMENHEADALTRYLEQTIEGFHGADFQVEIKETGTDYFGKQRHSVTYRSYMEGFRTPGFVNVSVTDGVPQYCSYYKVSNPNLPTSLAEYEPIDTATEAAKSGAVCSVSWYAPERYTIGIQRTEGRIDRQGRPFLLVTTNFIAKEGDTVPTAYNYYLAKNQTDGSPLHLSETKEPAEACAMLVNGNSYMVNRLLIGGTNYVRVQDLTEAQIPLLIVGVAK